MNETRLFNQRNQLLGWVRLCKSGLWRAYSFKRGCGLSAFHSEQAAIDWVLVTP